MRVGEASSVSRLKVCLLLGGALGCAVYAGVLLRRRLQKPGSPPVVRCPFADNTVALLRDLHDGPFRFGDPTPIAAAARKEAMRRIRRQQAHRRHLRHRMRLLLFCSRQAGQAVQRQSRRSTPYPTPTLATTASAAAGGPPNDCAGTTDGSDYEGRFAEQHRRLRRRQQQQQRHRRSGAAANPADSGKTFVKHARAMLSSPVDGIFGTTPSLTSSSIGSETWNFSDTERRGRGRSSGSDSPRSSYFSDLYSSRSSSVSSAVDSYTSSTTSTTTTSTSSSCSTTSSSLASASLPASTKDEAASVATTGSTGLAAARDRLDWNGMEGGGTGGAEETAPQRSFSDSAHLDDAAPSHARRFSASYSHATFTTTTSASPHPPNNSNNYYYSSGRMSGGAAGDAGAAAAGLQCRPVVHRHSHPQASQQLPHAFNSTPVSSSQHHCRSSSHPGTHIRTASCPEGTFAAAAVPSVRGDDGEEPYGYPLSTALYGPPLFATEMDVTDALAELRGSTCYNPERQLGGNCLGYANNNNNTAGSMGGGGGGSSLGAAALFGGALTLSAAGGGQPSPPAVAGAPTYFQGHGASSCRYPNFGLSFFTSTSTNSNAVHTHHRHSRSHRSFGQRSGEHHHSHSHMQSRQQQRHHQRSGSAGGSGPYHCVSFHASPRHSRNGSPTSSQLQPAYTSLPGFGAFRGASPLPPSMTAATVSNGSTVAGSSGAPLSRMSSSTQQLNHMNTDNSTTGYSHFAGAAAAAGRSGSFHSVGDGTRRHSHVNFRKLWRRTRRHVRRRVHDGRASLAGRAGIMWNLLRHVRRSLQEACIHGARSVGQRAWTLVTQLVRRRLRRAQAQNSGAVTDADTLAALSKRVTSDAALGAPDSSPAARDAATNAADASAKSKLTDPASLDGCTTEEAMNKVVQMLAPGPGRVPTVVVIRGPLGYDVSNDADSLWAALHLDSTSAEEGLVDVVMMEELKTEPLPPVPPARTVFNPPGSRSSSTPSEAGGLRRGANTTRDSNGDPHADGGAASNSSTDGAVTSEKARQLPHPLSLDFTSDAATAARESPSQRHITGPSNLLHTPPPLPLPSSSPPAERPCTRSSTLQPTPAEKTNMRITFELYPAHIFYSSFFRAAILQEKDLALRRAAAELYGGSADLDGGGSKTAVDPTGTALGGGGGGTALGCSGSPSSPSTLARAASSSVIATGQRSTNNSHASAWVGGGGGGSAPNTNSSNALNSMESFCLTPIAAGHFLRAPRSPKVLGMHHSHSSPTAGFGHPHHHGGITTANSSSGSPLLPPPSPPLGAGASYATATTATITVTAAAVGSASNPGSGGGGGFMPSPTALSPAFAPSMPGATSNVVVRLSASYSFPALPPQVVRSPLLGAESVVPHSARGGGGSGPLSLGSIGASMLNVSGAASSCGVLGGAGSASTPTQGHALGGGNGGHRAAHNVDRSSAARRVVNRNEVLLYIHALRTVVAETPAATATALPSCAISDFGEDDGVGGQGYSGNRNAGDTMTSASSAMHRGTAQGGGDGGGGGTVSLSASVCTAKPSSTPAHAQRQRERRSREARAQEEADGVDSTGDDNQDYLLNRHDEEYDEGDVDDGRGVTGEGSADEQEEEAQMVLELRQREIEPPVLLRYRLRICHQGTRSLEALKKAEKYAQDHVQVWQEEAKKMLQAMPPTEAEAVSAVTSGRRVSSASSPSLMMMSSPVLRPVDAASTRLPPPVGGYSVSGMSCTAQLPMQRSGSRYCVMPSLSLRTAPPSNYREEDRDVGPLHLPAWAMEVLIRRESMRETLIRDLKEKAFRICSIPLPDMRVHCLLPPVVPRYTAAHARGFPLSRTFAEEVLSQQRTLQYILLQREQENQRVIEAQIRRAMRRQERHARRRRERRAREEARQRQLAEMQRAKKQTSLKSRLSHSMNPTTIVSRVASIVKKSTTSNDGNSKDRVKKMDAEGAALAAVSATTQTTMEAAGAPSTSGQDPLKSNLRPGGRAPSTPTPTPTLPQQQQQQRQDATFPQQRNVSQHTLTSPTDQEVHFLGGSSQNSTTFETPQDPSLTPMLHNNLTTTTTTTTIVTTGSNASGVSSGTSFETFTGAVTVSNQPIGSDRGQRGMRWNTQSNTATPVSALPSIPFPTITTSAKSSPVQPPLHWQAHSSLIAQGGGSGSHSHTHSSAGAGSGGNGGSCYGGRISPLSTPSGARGSNWTAVHTSTNANASVTPPPPPLTFAGGVSQQAENNTSNNTSGGGGSSSGVFSHLHHNVISSMNLSAFDGDGGADGGADGDTEQEDAFATSTEAANRFRVGADVANHSHQNKQFSSIGVQWGRDSTRGSSLVSLGSSDKACVAFPPPTVTPPAAAGMAATTTTTTAAVALSSTASAVNRAGAATAANTRDMDPPKNAVLRDGSLELDVTPPVLYFTRPQSAAGVLSSPPQLMRDQPTMSASSTRASLLVPTRGYAAAGGVAAAAGGNNDSDNGNDLRLPSLHDSGTCSPLHGETLPASSTASIPLAVPNNSMYGTFDAYYGHSAATPQAVLLRQQAQAAAVAGLTSSCHSGSNNNNNGGGCGVGGGSAAVSLSSSLPSHLRRSPAAPLPATTTSAAAATTAAKSATYGLTGATASLATVGTGVAAVTSGATSRLPQSPSPPKSTSGGTPLPVPVSQHLQVPRSTAAASSARAGGAGEYTSTSNNHTGNGGGGGGGPRRTGSGLLPYTYSADSVSSMYGTAHYPLYQYPDDTPTPFTGTGGNAAGTLQANVGVHHHTSHHHVNHHHRHHYSSNHHHVISSGALGGLTRAANATAICASPTSAMNSALNGGLGPEGDSHHWIDSPIDTAAAHTITSAAAASSSAGGLAVLQDTHMNRLKQYNKLLSDLLGVAGGPMRSGISFYYTYGDATALLYNASIQAPSDEDILELLEQQRWTPQPGQEKEDMQWDGPPNHGSADGNPPTMTRPMATTSGGSPASSGTNHAASTNLNEPPGNAAGTSTGSGSVSSPKGSGSTSNDSVVSSASPSPPAARIPPTLATIGESPPPAPAVANTGNNGGSSHNNNNNNDVSPVADVAYEDEGCSYLDYGDLSYPEDSMDALEAEQIGAQRARNKNFYSIFEHLHRAYHDAVFEPRESPSGGRSHVPPYATGLTGAAGINATTTAAAATTRPSLPPLGGFTTTTSFAGSLGSPHSATPARSFLQSILLAPSRVAAFACSLVRWVGWKVGLLAAAPASQARSNTSGNDDAAAATGVTAYCGVLSGNSLDSFSSSSSPSSRPAGTHVESDEERLARCFPGERVVTFGKEWRVASHMDMQNGHYGLSPLQVWMATRYSRRFAGEVYLMDVVAAGSDPYYPAVRVLDEVVAHAVLYYYNHSLRDFTEDLASELGLEYVPQTVWGRRALGLPIDEAEVQELDGLLYTATRRQQDRWRRRQQQQQQEQRARQRHRTSQRTPSGPERTRNTKSTRDGMSSSSATARTNVSKPSGRTSSVVCTADPTTTTTSASAAFEEKGAFVAFEYGNDADRPHSTSAAAATLTSAVPRAVEDDDEGDDIDAHASRDAGEGGEEVQNDLSARRTMIQQARAPAAFTSADTKKRVAVAFGHLATPTIMHKSSSSPVMLPSYSSAVNRRGRRSPGSNNSSSSSNGCHRSSNHIIHHSSGNGDDSRYRNAVDPFAGVNESLWIEMQSYDQEEDEEVFYGATAAAVVGIGSGDINMVPHVYDAVMEREVYDERMLLRELDHLKDFLIENRNVLSSAMLTATGSNALEAVFGVPATVFPFLLCARESVPLVSSIFESLSYHYGALTYDNFSKMTYDAYHVDRPDRLRHTPRLFRMVNKSRRGCVTYEELCGWLARKLSCGNNIQPNAHLLAAIMSLRLPLALVAESREEWDQQRCALKSLSDAEDEEY